MKKQILYIQRAMRERGLSRTYISQVILNGSVGVSYVSRLLHGGTDGLNPATLRDVVEKIVSWIDEQETRIAPSYKSIHTELQKLDASDQKVLLKRINNDFN